MPRCHSNRVRTTSILALLLAITVCVNWAARTASTASTPTPGKTQTAKHSINDATAQRNARQAYGRMPMSFEANQGQTDAQVNFIAHGPGYNLFLTPGEAVLVLQPNRETETGAPQAEDDQTARPHHGERQSAAAGNTAAGAARATVLRMQLLDANARPTAIHGDNELPGKINYMFGSDPRNWRTNIPTYGQVRYEQVYPGVDMVYYGNQQQLEYDFVVAPGANADVIKLNYDGAQSIRPDGDGGLVLKTAGGELRQHKPVLYQQAQDGTRTEVGGRYVLKGKGQVGFKVSKYDRRKPLIIDPILSYLSLVNAGSDGTSIAVDPSGFAYITGAITLGNGVGDLPPTPGAYQTVSGGGADVFVTKINQAGNGVVYSTFLGGNGDDFGYAIAADLAGNAYVTGVASGTFPVTPGAAQPLRGSAFDAFVTKLNPTGSALVYSTFLGGNEYDDGDGIAVDAAGNAYVAGQTLSNNLATTPGVVRPNSGGGSDAFVAKFNSGGGLAYLTYLGGGGFDYGLSIAVDDAGNTYATGLTTSLNFPQAGGLQGPGGLDRGFFKSTDAGNSYSLRRTGMNDSYVYAIAVDPNTPTTIYAGSGGGVYKSTDGANSWTQPAVVTAPRSTIRALLIDRATPTTIYAGGGSGVFKSTNSGNTWTAVNNGLVVAATGGGTFVPNVVALASPVSATSTVYAASASGMFKTTDGGANWSSISTGLVGNTINSVALDPTNAQIVYAGTTLGVSKSTNGGASWTTINVGLNTTSSKNVNTLAIDPTNGATIYAATQAGVFKTTNSGSLWTIINNGLSRPNSDGSFTTNPPIRSLVINPTTPTTLYAGVRGAFFFNGVVGLTTIFKSTDGGANWTAVRNGFGNFSAVWSLAIDPLNPTTVYAGTLGDDDAYLTKINATGSALSYSTYLGGGRADFGQGVAVDSSGSAYVSGTTQGSGFPLTPGAFQTVSKGDNDVFLTKFDPAGTSRVYSTLIGGSSHEDNYGVAVDNAGNAYVSGGTYATDFPVTPGSFQTKLGGNGLLGTDDVYIAKVNPSGSALLYSSYLGGSGSEPDARVIPLNIIGVDAFGNAYVVGTTNDTNTFANFGSASSNYGGGSTFVAKINANAQSYSITGRLTTTGGAPIANQSVDALDLRNRFVQFGNTDSNGYYQLINLAPGDYTVVPSQFGGAGQFNFNPASRTFTGLSADQTADFVGTPLYFIKGQVKDVATAHGVAGVAVTLSGAATATLTTDLNGFYYFDRLTPGGNYTVTPAKAGYTFNPVNRTFTNLSANQNNIDFTTPSARFYNLSGRVADAGNNGVAGVSIQLAPFQNFVLFATTDASGNYLVPNLQSDLNYTVVPTKPLLTFSPYNPTIGNFNGPVTVNFTATPVTGLTGKLAFARNNSGQGGNGTNIYVANADGTNATNTTNDSAFNVNPTWSPDGTKLAFDSDRGDPVNLTNDIYTINADGTGLVRLTNTAINENSPAWSSDGAKIAYNTDCSSADFTPVEIYTVNPDGNGLKQLTNNQVADGLPDWSPDATKLAFARSRVFDCSGSEAEIWAMNADGSGQTRLTTSPNNSDYDPAWSPDGSKIAFIRGDNTSFANQIFVMNADGTGLQNLTPFLSSASSPTWSPDGTKIAFSTFLSNSTDLYVINADGTGFAQITGGLLVSSYDPVWRPDLNLQPANIGGRIADANGVAISGATVSLGGTQAGSTTTDANGFYSFRNISRGGNYTVTPALAGRTFSPAQQSFNNLLGTAAGNFGSAAVTVSVSGRVVDVNSPSVGLGGVTVTLSGSASGSTTTDANGNYTFAGLAPGGNYTVTPTRTNYQFESPAQSFSNVQTNRTADFIGTLVYVISGRVTDGANGAGLSNVTITVSGTRTVITTTDQSGNYSVTIAAGGTYSVVATSPYNIFAPPRADFPVLSAPQTANFVTVPAALPTPTPPLSENFNSPTRDPEKFNLGTLSQDPAAVDPLIPVVQRAGTLQITPRPNVSGEHYNGYVSVRPFDFTGGTAGVEVVQTTTSTAETIFGLGSDNQNNYRFVVTTLGSAAPQVRAAMRVPGGRPKLDVSTLVLVFQVKISGVVTQQAIPYDTVQHRFWRFRHDAPQNAILFETSPDNNAFTERYRKTLDKSVSALAVELTAGTATPTGGGGTAIYDNLNIMTSSMEFSAASFRVAENALSATLTVIRTGNIAGPATVDYTTMDDTAEIRCDDTTNNHGTSYARCDYATSVDTLTFAPGEAQKSLTIPIIDDAFVEGDETVRLILRNPVGAGLSSAIGATTLTIVDNDTNSNAPNPVFATPFFVRQQYLDFLAREPEATEPWSRVLNNCADVNTGPDVPSGCDRIVVSGAFFGSPEFKDKGLYVIIFYRVAFNRLPAYLDFAPDLRSVTGATVAESFAKRAAFARAFTQRPEFVSIYGGMTDAAYVAALLSKYQLSAITTPDPQNPDGILNPDGTRTIQKVTLTQPDLVNRLATGALTRAQVLRAVVQADEISQNREAVNAFVASQYYGYLRRTPDTGGFNGWVNYLTTHPGDFRTMVNGFVNSIEYRLRFGKPN